MPISQSQFPSHELDPEWVTIPLEKFSFAVSPLEARSHQWVHDSRRDELFLVFRPERVLRKNGINEKTTLMIVLAGGDVLERQNASSLAAIAEDFKIGVRLGRLDPALEAPVHVVIKCPCIAVRYPLSPSSVRRIQMKFQTSSDYETAVNIFMQNHFPVRSAGGKNNSVISDKVMRSAPVTVVQDRPVFDSQEAMTSRLLPVYESIGASASKSTLHGTSWLGSLQELKSFKGPPTASSDSGRPNTAWSMSSAKKSEATSSTSLEPYCPSHFQEKADFVTTKTPDPAFESHPPSIPLGLLSHTTSQSRSQTVNHFESSLLTAQGSRTEVKSPSRYEDAVPLRRTASTQENSRFLRQSLNPQSDQRSPFVPGFLRPGSAPVLETQSYVDQWIPPRRELPFSKARMATKSITTTINSPRVAHEIAFNPTFDAIKTKENKAVMEHNLTQDKQKLAQHRDGPIKTSLQSFENASISNFHAEKGENSSGRSIRENSLENLSLLTTKNTAVAKCISPPDISTVKTPTVSRKRGNDALMDLESRSKYTKTMVDRATQTQTLSGRDHTAAHILKETSIESPPQDFMNEIDSFVTKHKNRPPPKEIWERPEYAEASPEQRQAIINEFICENLDSEEFLKLCEDTAEVWQRIGLEM